MATKIKKGDRVMLIKNITEPDDKTTYSGTIGTVLKVFPKKQRVIVEGINMQRIHQKRKSYEQPGGVIEKEAPIHISNVMLVDKKSGKPTRVGFRINDDGSKERIARKSGEAI